MEKIVIETNMKKLPETCSKCRFKKDKDNTTFCTAPGNNIKLVKTYVKERYNYCYLIPDTCPLASYEVEE